MSDKKIYRPYDFQNTIKVQEVATLPSWTAADRRRLIRVIGTNKFYFGGAAGWEETSISTHTHSGYAADDHTHTQLNNNVNVTGDVVPNGYLTGKQLEVNGVQVVDTVGYIDFSRIKNHPTYCSVNCVCDCTSNCNCDCSGCDGGGGD